MTQSILKKWFKWVARHEERGSLVLGSGVVLVLIGGLLYSLPHFSFQFSVSQPQPSQVPVEQIEQAIEPVEEKDVRKHTVQAGEGLWQIAEQYYQDGFQYLKIYEANKDQMRSPEDIREGMELVIPDITER